MTCTTGDVCAELAEKLAKTEAERDEFRDDYFTSLSLHKDQLESVTNERDEARAVINIKSGDIIAVIADALIRMPEEELDDHSYHMGAARARASIIQEVQRFLGVTKWI